MRRCVILSAALLVLAPTFAFAQATAPAYFGLQTTTQNPPQTPPPPDENKFKDAYLAVWFGKLVDSDSAHGSDKQRIGVAFGFWQRGILGAEIDFGLAKDFFGDPSLLGGTNLITLTANAVIGPWIKFSDNQALRPYFLIGGGLMRSTFEGFAQFPPSSENRGLIDIGGGAHFYIIKAVGVRVDYRLMKDFGSKDPTGPSFGLTGRQFTRLSFAGFVAF